MGLKSACEVSPSGSLTSWFSRSPSPPREGIEIELKRSEREGFDRVYGGFDDRVGVEDVDVVGRDGFVQGMTGGVFRRVDGHDLGCGRFYLDGGRKRVFGLALKVVRFKGLQRRVRAVSMIIARLSADEYQMRV
jgi:hypothetical protein